MGRRDRAEDEPLLRHRASVVTLDGRRVGELVVRSYAFDRLSIVPRYLAVCGALFFAATGLALFMGRWLAGLVIQPVNRLSQAMREVTDLGDYSQRVPKWASDEFGLLTDSFNDLLAQLQANDGALHRAMTDLVEARDAAQAANVLKSQFLANMSHEIRTPLNGVLAMAQIIALGELTPQQRERVEVIRRSGEDLLNVLNDVLDISKIEAGKMELEIGEVDAEVLGGNVEATFAPLAETKKNLRFKVEVRPEARGPRRGDPLAHRPDPQQPRFQRDQVHRRGSCRCDRRRHRSGRPRRAQARGRRHRPWHPGRQAAAAVPEVQPGGRVEHPPLRRHRARPRHLPRARPAHARQDRGRKHRGRRLDLHRHAARATAGRPPPAPRPPRPAPASSTRPVRCGCWRPRTSRPTSSC